MTRGGKELRDFGALSNIEVYDDTQGLVEEQPNSYGAIKPEVESDANDVTFMSPRLRIVKTICMLGIYIGLGLWAGIVNTTNVDMVNMYNCTYDQLTRATTVKSLGIISGSFLGATIADRWRSRADLFLSVVCIVGGTTLALVPWSPGLIVMGIIFIINGLCHGISNVVCSSVTLAIWGTAAATPLIALHTCFSLGTAFAPIITVPFLSHVDSNNTVVPGLIASISLQNIPSDDATYLNGLNGLFTDPYMSFLHTVKLEGLDGKRTDKMNSSYNALQNAHSNIAIHQHNATDITSSHIRIPYGLFGLWSIFVGVIFLSFYLRGSTYTTSKKGSKESMKEMLNPRKCAEGSLVFGLYFMTSLLFLFICLNGRDRSLPSFLFAIANKGLGMSKSMAALLLTTYSFVAALSRGLCAVISRFVRIQYVLLGEIIGAILLQMYLVFYGLSSGTALWVLSCLLVCFTSPSTPTVIAWANCYIHVTGAVMAIVDIGIGLGGFIAVITTGSLFQNHGSQAVILFNFILGCCLTAMYIPMQVVGLVRGERHIRIGHAVNQNHVTEVPAQFLEDEDSVSNLSDSDSD